MDHLGNSCLGRPVRGQQIWFCVRGRHLALDTGHIRGLGRELIEKFVKLADLRRLRQDTVNAKAAGNANVLRGRK